MTKVYVGGRELEVSKAVYLHIINNYNFEIKNGKTFIDQNTWKIITKNPYN